MYRSKTNEVFVTKSVKTSLDVIIDNVITSKNRQKLELLERRSKAQNVGNVGKFASTSQFRQI